MKTKRTSFITWVLACMIVVGTTGVFATSVQADEGDISTIEGSDEYEEIKNGMLYSDMDGDATTLTGYSISEDTVVSKNDGMAIEQIIDPERFKIYEQFGMTYDVNKNQLTFDGKSVRWFEDYYPVDGTDQAGAYHFDADGIVDVYAVRDLSNDPSGELVGLRKFSQEEFDSRDIERIKNSTQGVIAGYPISDDEINAWLTEYEAFGVTYDRSNKQWYFNGERVRRIMDILTSNGEDLSSRKFHGSVRTLNGNGTVDIYTVRDFDNLNSEGNGTLIDVKAYSQ